MKAGDPAEIRDLEGNWLPCKVLLVQKDGTFKVKVAARTGHLYSEMELICDSENVREKKLDTETESVLNAPVNEGKQFHS